jgi:hypothetical protein
MEPLLVIPAIFQRHFEVNPYARRKELLTSTCFQLRGPAWSPRVAEPYGNTFENRLKQARLK